MKNLELNLKILKFEKKLVWKQFNFDLIKIENN